MLSSHPRTSRSIGLGMPDASVRGHAHAEDHGPDEGERTSETAATTLATAIRT